MYLLPQNLFSHYPFLCGSVQGKKKANSDKEFQVAIFHTIQ